MASPTRTLSRDEARATAKAAYVYGVPLVAPRKALFGRTWKLPDIEQVKWSSTERGAR